MYDTNRDNYIIINGRDIELGPEVEYNYFWEMKEYREEDYLKLLLESQGFFYQYLKNIPDIDKIYTSTGYQQLMLWVSQSNCVRVTKHGSKYRCTFNGRHRCAVAKKYGLDILVLLW